MKGIYESLPFQEDISKLPEILLTDREAQKLIEARQRKSTWYSERLKIYITEGMQFMLREPKRYRCRHVLWSILENKEYYQSLDRTKLYDFDKQTREFYIVCDSKENMYSYIKQLKLVPIDDFYDNITQKNISDVNKIETIPKLSTPKVL